MKMNKILKIILTVFLFIKLLLISNCISGPAVIQNYSKSEKSINKYGKRNILLYRIVIEGDNYDKMIQKIVLDKTIVFFNNINADVFISDNVFVNDIDSRNLIFENEYIDQNYDYVFLLIIRTKYLGYSIRTLSDETNIYLKSSLFDGKGELLTTSLFTKTTLYPISKVKRFHFDLMKVLNPISGYIQAGSNIEKKKKKNEEEELE